MRPTPTGSPLICAPLPVEWAALRGRSGRVRVVRTGMGPRRSTASVASILDGPRPVLVAGVAGGLSPDVRPGDVVVASDLVMASEVMVASEVMTAGAPVLAGALRQLGLRVHVGPVACVARPVDGPARRALAATGALAVDMESAWLAPAAAGGPFAVVRAIVDTADYPLWRPGTVVRGVLALAALRRAAPALAEWTIRTALSREVS